MINRNHFKLKWGVFCGTVVLSVTMACGKTSQVHSLKELKSRNAKSVNIVDSKNSDASSVKTIERSVEAAAEFQVKNVAVLRSTLEACLGKDITKISDSMIIPAGQVPGAQDADGRVKFLGSGSYKAGDDVLEKEAKNLEGQTRGTRLGTLADSLTASYLMSLGIVADVAAHNCDPAKNALCACASPEDAAKLLSRCLPSFDPQTEDFKEAAMGLSKKCSVDKFAYRQGIASLIGSISFAKAR